MFSRGPGSASRGTSGNNSPHGHVRKTEEGGTALDELIACLDRMEFLVQKARSDWQDRKKPKQKGGGGLWRRGTSSKKMETDDKKTPPRGFKQEKQLARFLPLDSADQTELVEVLRRTAELVVMGERGAAKAQSKREKKVARKLENPDQEEKDDEEEEHTFESYIALFEQFFERNALSLIVTIVTGAAFSSLDASFSNLSDASLDVQEQELSHTMLPPLPVATQAVQSVSILIQNVSRATSLYFLLSNNHINELINLPLELYTIAEQEKRGDNANGFSPKRYSSPELSELSTHFVSFLKSLALRMNKETLQFFLTYPAERRDDFNASASSAYFSQQDNNPVVSTKTRKTRSSRTSQEDRPLDEVETNKSAPQLSSTEPRPVAVPEVEVEFPLYARALDFCSTNQDSFVRVTAMNICLNTLRLATVSDSTDATSPTSPSRSSPDAVLHNAEPLPIRERLAIAQHVCAPSRVEGLVSPIFTKLAQLWGILEELIREVDSPNKSAPSTGNLGTEHDVAYSRNTKAEKAKEEVRRSRMTDSVKDAVANLQDELLLLEDVFKVGLTSLNEQIIEMMLATFVYPLLLQPLLLFMQRFPSDKATRSRNSSVNPFSIDSLTTSLAQSELFGKDDNVLSNDPGIPHVDTAPAKTALFVLASVFHLVTNHPLLRLLLTALFHPLAPEASGESMIRAKPDVACAGLDGRISVRVDQTYDTREVPNDRSTYVFGKLTGQRYSGNHGGVTQDEACVFVLSPALAGVLESSGGELSLISKTRPNPYRRAILACVGATGVLTELRALAVLSIDAALSRFDGVFVSNMLFGAGMRTFANDIPMDERRTDTRIVRDRHDRDIGGAGVLESRRVLPAGGSRFQQGDGTSSFNEVIASFCVSVLTTSSKRKGTWQIEFDRVAAHSLLCAIRENPKALQTTAKMIERRRYETGAFLSQLASRIAATEHYRSTVGSQTAPGDEEHHIGAVMNKMFYESVGYDCTVVEELLQLNSSAADSRSYDSYSVAVALESSFEDLSKSVCNFDALTSESQGLNLLEVATKCSSAYLQLDAFSALVQDLAATKGRAVEKIQLAGFAISRNGFTVSTTESYEKDVRQSVFAPVSRSLGVLLIEEREEGMPSHREREQPKPGSVVGLVGRTAFPCVCEVPAANASLFMDNVTSVVSEGVKWQSLYLVFLSGYMVLAEPEKGGSGGNGRIITSCSLSRLKVDRDHAIPVHSGSSARRLLLSHDSFDTESPSLFLFEEEPAEKEVGPFIRVQSFRSCVDLWFEDETSVDRAAKVLEIKIAKAKARRGNRLREILAPAR